ncbi:RNA polymerase sigma factor [Candidatus Uabimicrobium sp. HlEnr_7]|uniref:RNA polymerase sigma factor n=1 Tax=Candidatus Uabimicrobium helgolandensis TaxID=3095367 RepID=UPI0035575341
MSEKIENLASSLQKGNMEVFPEIMEHYRPIMYRIVFAITRSQDDTEDIIQETFVIMLEKIEQWHGKNFHAWVLRIAKNLSIDHLRKKRVKLKNLPRHYYLLQSLSSQKDVLIEKEQIDILHSIIDSLPPKQKQILYLKHFQKMSIRDIAVETGCAEGTVKATLFQTLKKLKNQFKEQGLME